MQSIQPALNPKQQAGYVTAAVLVLLVISAISGAYMLKSSKHRAATASNYFQGRSATYAAQSGIEAGMADLEANPTTSTQLLNNFLADNSKAWLLGGVSKAGSANWINLGTNKQQFATKVVAFDPNTGLVKLEGSGRGPGGSESVAYGVFQIGGIEPDLPKLAKYAWYMAGEAHNVDKTVDVEGDAYFGGDVHFNGGADGSIFRGTVKIAKGLGNQSSFDAKVTFIQNAYICTPFKTQGNGIIFQKSVGFEGNVFANTDFKLTGSNQIAYFNSDINGGNAKIDLVGNKLIDNGKLNMTRAKNYSSVTHLSGTIPIADNLGFTSGSDEEVSLNFTAIPNNKRFKLASLGYGAWGTTNGLDLSAAYATAKATGKLFKDFLVLDVSQGLAFAPIANNLLTGKFIFLVTGSMTVNTNFPPCDPTTLCVISVSNSGSMQAFGSSGKFRGYVNVSGNGSVIYQWGLGGEFHGAIHHVSTTTSFQLNNSPSPLKLVFDATVFDEIAGLGILVPAGKSVPVIPTPMIKLVDTQFRPIYLSRYF